MRALVVLPTDVDARVARLESRLGEPIQLVGRSNRDTALVVVGEPAPIVDHVRDGRMTTVALGTGLCRPNAVAGASGATALLDGQFLGVDDCTAASLDEQTGELTIATGGGPHRWYAVEDEHGLLAVATSMEAATAAVQVRVDRSREDFHLGFGFLPDPVTMFGGIRRLPGDALLRIAPGNGLSRVRSGATEDDQQDGHAGSEDLVAALQDAVATAAAGRDRHAVLMGGFDSALVAAMLRRAGVDVVAYTFRFPDPAMNQANVDVVVDTLGIDHEWVDIEPGPLGELLRHLPMHLNAPTAQPHYQLHTVLASQRIAQDGFDLVFTGDGCDSLFLGYPTVHMRSRLGAWLRRLPPVVARAGQRLLGMPTVEAGLGHVARVGRSSLRASQLPWPAAGHLPTQYLDAVTLDRLRGDRPTQSQSPEEIRLRLADGLDHLDAARLAYHGNGLTGASGLKVDGAVASAGIGHWTPYGAPAVRRIARTLASEQLRRPSERAGGLGKAALIDAVLATDLLPREVVLQPKQSPATAPIDSWYRTTLRPVVDELLGELPFEVDRAAVDRILRPTRAEDIYRSRVTLSKHTLQAIGLLCSYGAFARLANGE